MTNSHLASPGNQRTLFLDVEGGRLAYDLQGEGPLVVLAHGLGDSRASYDRVAPKVAAAGYRVARLDLRGCGLSSVGWDDYSRTAIAGDILGLIRALGGPATVVGHSIAGGAATIAAATAPDFVTALVELAPFTRKQSFGLKTITTSRVRKGINALLAAGMLGRVGSWLHYLDLATPGEKPADWDRRTASVEAMLREPGRMNAFKAMVKSKPADAGAKLPAVTQQTVVVMGEDDPDWVDPRAEGEGIVSELPAGLGRLETIPGVGHYPHYQTPDEVAAIVIAAANAATSRA